MNIIKFLLFAFCIATIFVVRSQTQILECQEGEFECADGISCIPGDYQCDHDPDCKDASDEVNCTCDTKYEYTCPTGECIPWYYVCDGHQDCGDKADEKGCKCDDGFFCKSDALCLPAEYECDLTVDCEDGSDEDEEKCACDEDEYDCGLCINPIWVCDYVIDCPDASDEGANCNYTMAVHSPQKLESLQQSRQKEKTKYSKSVEKRSQEILETKKRESSKKAMHSRRRQNKRRF